jgi:hypothetical protein
MARAARENKYEHIMQFAAALPALRNRVATDMKLDGLPREKVLATIVSLLEKTLIRVGNTQYAENNKSYGLTTMRRKHVGVGRGVLRFDFTGKSGKQWKLRVEDKRIAAIAKRCGRSRDTSFSSIWTMTDSLTPSIPATSMLTSSYRRGFQRQGLPNLGGNSFGGTRPDRI